MDNKLSTIALLRLTSQNRELLADQLVKSNAPNAKDLCSGQLNFASTFNEIERQANSRPGMSQAAIEPIIKNNIETVKLNKSVREASVDLSQAYIMNVAMLRLLNHYYKQDRAVIDGYRPN